MIDPKRITDYKLSLPQLEERILWWVCAAGKNGVAAANSIQKFLDKLRTDLVSYNTNPFSLIANFLLPYTREVGKQKLAERMKEAGIGCYNNKAETFIQLASSAINLQTCTIDELTAIKGIGPKTARAFIMHSRPNQKMAALDTHLLKFLRDQGITAPKSTPSSPTKYKILEIAYLNICGLRGLDAADLDLAIWNHYRETPNIPFDIEEYTNDYHQYCSIGCSC